MNNTSQEVTFKPYKVSQTPYNPWYKGVQGSRYVRTIIAVHSIMQYYFVCLFDELKMFLDQLRGCSIQELLTNHIRHAFDFDASVDP